MCTLNKHSATATRGAVVRKHEGRTSLHVDGKHDTKRFGGREAIPDCTQGERQLHGQSAQREVRVLDIGCAHVPQRTQVVGCDRPEEAKELYDVVFSSRWPGACPVRCTHVASGKKMA